MKYVGCFCLSLILLSLLACQQNNDEQTQQRACSKDLQICSDGQTVGRNQALACEFNPCPPSLAKDQCQSDMKQCPDGSFVFRDEAKDCEFKPCPSESDKQATIVYCPQDARQCPDGSYVGRDPKNNCAFKLCPDGSQPSEQPLREIE